VKNVAKIKRNVFTSTVRCVHAGLACSIKTHLKCVEEAGTGGGWNLPEVLQTTVHRLNHSAPWM